MRTWWRSESAMMLRAAVALVILTVAIVVPRGRPDLWIDAAIIAAMAGGALAVEAVYQRSMGERYRVDADVLARDVRALEDALERAVRSTRSDAEDTRMPSAKRDAEAAQRPF